MKISACIFLSLTLPFSAIASSNYAELNLNISSLQNTAHSISEDDSTKMWQAIDALNKKLTVPEKINSDSLAILFKNGISLSSGRQIERAFGNLRAEAFGTDDFTTIDKYVARCSPAITVMIKGESNSIGININYFLEKSTPKTVENRFFNLAKDGFYADSTNYCAIGTAEFPKWLERTESSAQADVMKESAKSYLAKWKALRPELKGVYKEIADITIHCLESF